MVTAAGWSGGPRAGRGQSGEYIEQFGWLDALGGGVPRDPGGFDEPVRLVRHEAVASDGRRLVEDGQEELLVAVVEVAVPPQVAVDPDPRFAHRRPGQPGLLGELAAGRLDRALALFDAAA